MMNPFRKAGEVMSTPAFPRIGDDKLRVVQTAADVFILEQYTRTTSRDAMGREYNSGGWTLVVEVSPSTISAEAKSMYPNRNLPNMLALLRLLG